jgi:putative hydrolase of the HAD superfamily
VCFDVYGTLVDISTDEDRSAVWTGLSRELRHRGYAATPDQLHRRYREEVRRRLRDRHERHPEIDVPRIFATVLHRLGGAPDPGLAATLARRFRALSTLRLAAFPDALPTLHALRTRVSLAAVSDAQRLFLEPELRAVGLAGHFDVLVVSSDHGFRKPDPRLFRLALEQLGVPATAALHVGDNPDRDVAGARAAGLLGVHLDRAGTPPHPDHTVSSLLDLLRWVQPRTR